MASIHDHLDRMVAARAGSSHAGAAGASTGAYKPTKNDWIGLAFGVYGLGAMIGPLAMHSAKDPYGDKPLETMDKVLVGAGVGSLAIAFYFFGTPST
jgi:hypothetical protein